jgi:hypothetical protein
MYEFLLELLLIIVHSTGCLPTETVGLGASNIEMGLCHSRSKEW